MNLFKCAIILQLFVGDFARLLLWLSSQSFNPTNRFSTHRFLLSYFKTLSIGPAGVELTTFRVTARCSTNWATGARFEMVCSFFRICLLPKCCVLSDIQKKTRKKKIGAVSLWASRVSE